MSRLQIRSSFIGVVLGVLFIATIFPQQTVAEVQTVTVEGGAIQQKAKSVRIGEVQFNIVKGATGNDVRLRLENLGDRKAISGMPRPKIGSSPMSDVYEYRVPYALKGKVYVDITVTPDNAKQEKRAWHIMYRSAGGQWKRIPSFVNKEKKVVRARLPEKSGQLMVVYDISKNEHPRKRENFQPMTASFSTRAIAVQDAESGIFFYKKNADAPQTIASITKLLTVYTFLKRQTNLDQTVTYHDGAKRIGATVMLNSGEQISAKQAVMGALIPSANNMAALLSQSSGSSEVDFIAKMNRNARDIGLNKATFVEATGLDARNKVTAKEVSMMARHIFSAYPDLFQEAAHTQVYHYVTRNTHRDIRIYSTNKFATEGKYDVEGFKTGYLPGTADRTLVMMLTEKATGKKILVTLLGDPNYNSIFSEASVLAKWAFSQWDYPEHPSFQ